MTKIQDHLAFATRLFGLDFARLGKTLHNAGLAFSKAVLFFAAAFAPLPYGSRDATTISAWCITLGLALMAASLQQLPRPQVLFSIGLIFVLCCGGVVLHEQLSSQPWFALPNPIWAEAGQALGLPVQPYVSILRQEPFFALGPPAAAVLSLWLGVILGIDRQVARRLLWTVAAMGSLYALFGIFSAWIEPNMLLLRERKSFSGFVIGTFVNRNTAAVFFGSSIVLWLLLIAERALLAMPDLFKRRLLWTELTLFLGRRDNLLPFAGFFICLTALFMTGSRAGIMLTLLVSMIAVTIHAIRERLQLRGLIVLLISMVCGIAVLYLLLGGTLNAHFNGQGFDDEGRFATYRSTLRLIGDHPWFGSGLGTFEWAFPAYRSAETSLRGTWDLAHSTPLELAADLGIPFALLIAAGWSVILWVLARGVFVRRRDTIIPLAALSVALIALLHSTIDFSLQVPGYTIVTMIIIGVGFSQSFASGKRVRR